MLVSEPTRRGDAWQTEIRAYDSDEGRGPHLLVSAHDDGGVTLQWFDRFKKETDRITVRREVWDAVLTAASTPELHDAE